MHVATLTDTDIGKYVAVSFLDHTENHGSLARIEATGVLMGFDEKSVCLRAWECTPKPDPDCQTEWHIIRSAILAMVTLKPVIERQLREPGIPYEEV